ncbi:hypothetical protein BDQ12DRAFT_315497 [Crucibulum laeve]|uniref:Uncharacterized protein n=1 Tax=Crucibulum laeve TaxID=68775 RepID=A0A5C3LE71_9AGAR|nr:hypothetical protein BDQ12DRAFT_315497 [Crucibulum laeve]
MLLSASSHWPSQQAMLTRVSRCFYLGTINHSQIRPLSRSVDSHTILAGDVKKIRKHFVEQQKSLKEQIKSIRISNTKTEEVLKDQTEKIEEMHSSFIHTNGSLIPALEDINNTITNLQLEMKNKTTAMHIELKKLDVRHTELTTNFHNMNTYSQSELKGSSIQIQSELKKLDTTVKESTTTLQSDLKNLDSHLVKLTAMIMSLISSIILAMKFDILDLLPNSDFSTVGETRIIEEMRVVAKEMVTMKEEMRRISGDKRNLAEETKEHKET